MARYDHKSWQLNMRVGLDVNNMMAAAIGPEHGVSDDEIAAHRDLLKLARATLERRRAEGTLAWAELPHQDGTLAEVLAYRDRVAGRFDAVVVLGIGGSALGTIALHTALSHPYHNQLTPSQRRNLPRLYVLDNIDPDWLAATLASLDPARTLVLVVTKSGTTAETMAQFLIARKLLADRLGAAHAEHVVAITDPEKGELRALAREQGYQTFAIHPGVGGRFSVLSPVGLVPAALVGVDVAELLAGAAYADNLCRIDDVWRNPAAMNALLQYILYRRGKAISVMMPYSQALRDVADWYRQLWAESLGKERSLTGAILNVGPTPVKSLGVTDQHSQLQLYAEGPNDKVIDFVAVARFATELAIPRAFEERPNVAYLGGRTMNELMRAEREGTAYALTRARRPNCTHTLPEVNAFTVGQLLFILEMQCAYAGELLRVDTYDQPGVESSKVAAYALMGRSGYEDERAAIEQASRPIARYQI